jgi:hypothetical protein
MCGLIDSCHGIYACFFFLLACICDPPVSFVTSMYVISFFLLFWVEGETLFAPRPLCFRHSTPSSMIFKTPSLQKKSWAVYVRF